MRQQMNDFREHLRIIALLRSRSYAVTKCFRLLIEQERLEAAASALHRERSVDIDISKLSSAELTPLSSEGYPLMAVQTPTNFESSDSFQVRTAEKAKSAVFHNLEGAAKELDAIGNAISLAPEDSIDKVIVIIADIMGSIWMLIAFVIGILAWIALGPKCVRKRGWGAGLRVFKAVPMIIAQIFPPPFPNFADMVFPTTGSFGSTRAQPSSRLCLPLC